GQITVTDQLPLGLTPTAAAGSGWTCGVATQTVTCARSDSLAPATSSPAITIAVSLAATARSLVNAATVAGGGDTTPGNNTVTIPVDISNIGPASEPDLIVEKSHTGVVSQGGTVTFEVLVRALAGDPTSGQITVTDPMPSGLTPTSASGAGWSCTTAQTVVC